MVTFPLAWGSCALGSKLGGVIAKKLYPVLFGPFGKALAPPIIPPAVVKIVKIFKLKVCPVVAAAVAAPPVG